MTRRTFFRRTVGALATVAIAPRVALSALRYDPWTHTTCGAGFAVTDEALADYARWLGYAARVSIEQQAAAVFTGNATA